MTFDADIRQGSPSLLQPNSDKVKAADSRSHEENAPFSDENESEIEIPENQFHFAEAEKQTLIRNYK